jgi:1A family penicillin-binding protein
MPVLTTFWAKIKEKIPFSGKPKRKTLLLFGLLAGVFLFLGFSVYILKDLPSPSRLADDGTIPYSTHIYSRDNKLLYEVFREENRTPVKLSSLPKYIKEATISIEDKDFYRHGGISIFGGVLRAVKETLIGKKLQGGSTITQQLVKSALLTPERTITRKIKEMILALLVENRYTKDEILEMYLNQVPYGGTAWGIQEASKLYFNKSATKLTLAQASMLAGLPQAPSLYSPYTNPKAAKARQAQVLSQMLEEGYITNREYQQSLKAKIKVQAPKNRLKAPHFVFYVKQLLEQEYGEKTVQEGGLRVYTTLDYSIQQAAEKILKEELEDLESYDVGNGAILVTRPSTGEILAMVGSRDFFEGTYGAYNVTTALRQPGSSIKPLNYAVGIERGLVSPSSVFLDMPSCFMAPGQPRGYCPRNYDGQFHGPVQLRMALANSLNIPAVKMLAMNGVENFIASASAFGITTFKDPKNYGLSLTLGGGEVKMTEMAKAFSAFPNQGVVKDTVSIIKVTDRNNNTLYEYEDSNYIKNVRKALEYPKFLAIKGKRVISQATAFLISHILLDNNARSQSFGTSSYLVVPNHSGVSVKTGTTDDLKDNWTIGYSPNFLTLVWVGNNDSSPMNPYLTSGVTGAAPIWNRVMQQILKNQPDLWPQKPDSVLGKEVCTTSGNLKSEGNDLDKECQTRFEYYTKDSNPKGVTIVKKKVFLEKDTNKLPKPSQTDNLEEQEKTFMTDAFSEYCLDCNHEGETPTNVIIR